MRKRATGKMTIAAFLAAAIAMTLGIAEAADINADFSTASNPNGVWTYGFSTTLGGTLTNYDQPGTNPSSGLQFWLSSTVQSLGAPSDANNPTDSTINPAGTNPLPPHTALFHPGPNGEFSVYRFTTPTTGTYDLSAIFGGIDSGGTDVHILDNGVQIFGSDITGGSSVPFSTSLVLATGDKIDFAVGVGADHLFFGDSTSINASITQASAVPEPATLTLLGIGLAGLGVARRRGKIMARRHSGRGGCH